MFVIKGINNVVTKNEDVKGKDAYIEITGELSHVSTPELLSTTTRFETFKEAKEVAERQVVGIFESFKIIKED